MARLRVKLRKNGIAKGLGSDACAIGDEEDGAVGHGRFGSVMLDFPMVFMQSTWFELASAGQVGR